MIASDVRQFALQHPIGLAIALVSLNGSLSLGFLVLAWGTYRLRRRVSQWETAIAHTERQLAIILANSPRQLSAQADALQQLQQSYQAWQVTLNRLQQTLLILRFLLRLLGQRR